MITRHAETRIPELDGIRGIAVLAVLVYHFGTPVHPTDFVHQILRLGWAGVDLFFVLSGYLITGILLDATGSPDYFRKFYIRRALRIFPLYYVFLLLYFHIGPLLSRIPHLEVFSRGAGAESWYWAYLVNWSPMDTRVKGLAHFWSLCVEEQFYLAWPLVVRFSSRRMLKWLCLALTIVSPLLRLLALHQGTNPYHIYEATFLRLDGLTLGALLALANRDCRLQQSIRRVAIPVTAVAALGMGYILWTAGTLFFTEPMNVWGHSALAVLFASMIFHATSLPGLRLSWLRSIGKYSYAMYVLHYPLTRLDLQTHWQHADDGLFARWVLFVLYVAAGVAVSYLLALVSWRLLEKPCADLKERLTSKRPLEPPVPAPPLQQSFSRAAD